MRKRRGKQEQAFEYRLSHILESKEYSVFNCARSKPVDLIAIKHGVPYLLEVKGRNTPLDKEQIKFQERMAKQSGSNYALLKQAKKRGKILLIREVHSREFLLRKDLEDYIIE